MSSQRAVSTPPPSGGTRYFLAVCAYRHPPFVVTVGGAGSSGATAPCPACGAPGRFVPGAYHTERTVETLRRVTEIIVTAQLSPRRARAAAQRLDHLSREPSRAQLRALLSEWPGLEQLEALVPSCRNPSEVHELRGFVGLLLGLFTVYADEYGSTPPPPAEELASPEPSRRQSTSTGGE